MSHPDPNGAPDLTPLQVGETLENPVNGERATLLELPNKNPRGRATAELTALAGARVVGEHRHPGIVERFTVIEGELTLKCDGRTSVLREGEEAVIEPNVWHDWWNASDHDARARVEVTPGERFAQAALDRPAHDLRRPRSHRTLARLPRHLPADLAHGTRSARVAWPGAASTWIDRDSLALVRFGAFLGTATSSTPRSRS